MPHRAPTVDPAKMTRFFLDCGYDQARFWTAGIRDAIANRGGGAAYFAERTSVPSRLNTLFRLFLLGSPVSRKDAEDFIPADVLGDFEACDLIRAENGMFHGQVMLTRMSDRLFAADRADALERPDVVIWPNPTTRLLDLFTIRSHSRATLDLGAGNGVQAVLAASHSDDVIATDLNHRAAQYTEFNAWLNVAMNVRTATGDTFDPVRGARFDLIVSNPPFFIGPASGRMYCESGMELDGYCRRLVREAPEFLNEGGWFQILFEWVEAIGETWQDRLIGWLENTGCDAWILHGFSYEPAMYAEIRTEQARTGGTRPDVLAQWMAYFRENHISKVHGGFLAMQRRSGRNWIRVDEVKREPAEPFGDTVAETFCSQTALAGCTDEQFMDLRPKVASGASLNQRHEVVGGRWNLVETVLERTGAVPASVVIDPGVAEFVARCDGQQTLGALAEQLSRTVGASVEEAEYQCRKVTRYLGERRLLIFF